MSIVEMNPDDVLKILEGYDDVLTDEVEKRAQLYKNVACPCCGSADMRPVPKATREGELVPYHHFRCEDCGCLYDPKSDLVIQDGHPPAPLTHDSG